MALWTKYDQVGIKEDVSDVISNISPTKTPFQSSIGDGKCDNTLFQWQEDSLRAVSDNNNQEGFTASDATLAATVMRNNVTQILQETIKVSGTSDAISHYGRAKESAYQMAKSSAAVKRDLENAFVGTAQSKVSPSDNTTNRKMAGYQAQLLNTGASPPNATNSVAYTGGSSTVPTEGNILDVLQQIYANGADPSIIMVTPSNSRTVADLAKATGRSRSIVTDGTRQSQQTLINVVDVYVSPFGEQKVVLNRFLKSTNTLIYDPEMWQQVALRPWFRETLAKTGDNTMMMIVGEYSLKHKNFAASGAIVQAAGPTGF